MRTPVYQNLLTTNRQTVLVTVTVTEEEVTDSALETIMGMIYPTRL